MEPRKLFLLSNPALLDAPLLLPQPSHLPWAAREERKRNNIKL